MPDAPLKLFPFEHHASSASCADDTNVSAGPGNGPHVAAAGMLLAELELHTYNHRYSLLLGCEPLQKVDR